MRFMKSITGVLVLSSLLATASFAEERSNGKFKFSATAARVFSLNSSESTIGGSVFMGERLNDWGDIGLYLLTVLPQGNLTTYNTAGIQVSPDLMRAPWGGILWSNRVGFGVYQKENQIHFSTGLIIETGSYFHISGEFFRGFEVKPFAKSYPSAFALGLGIHL